MTGFFEIAIAYFSRNTGVDSIYASLTSSSIVGNQSDGLMVVAVVTYSSFHIRLYYKVLLLGCP